MYRGVTVVYLDMEASRQKKLKPKKKKKKPKKEKKKQLIFTYLFNYVPKILICDRPRTRSKRHPASGKTI